MAKAAPDGWKRFKTLVHYVCDRCSDPAKLGATKLNKALWYSDTFAYRIAGKSVSGEAYVKRQFGPVPKNILRALQELEAEGALKIREVNFFGKKKREFISLKDADTGAFSDSEREIINEVVDQVCDGHTAVSISDLSHDAIWEAADLGEEIPLYAVLAAKAAPLTDGDYAWAEKVIKRHQGTLTKAA